MNKYQLALEILSDNAEMTPQNIDELQWADAVIKELVDKETPMKLKPNGENCGNCNELVYREYEKQCDNYCDGCGQKLDWTSEDE